MNQGKKGARKKTSSGEATRVHAGMQIEPQVDDAKFRQVFPLPNRNVRGCPLKWRKQRSAQLAGPRDRRALVAEQINRGLRRDPGPPLASPRRCGGSRSPTQHDWPGAPVADWLRELSPCRAKRGPACREILFEEAPIIFVLTDSGNKSGSAQACHKSETTCVVGNFRVVRIDTRADGINRQRPERGHRSPHASDWMGRRGWRGEYVGD